MECMHLLWDFTPRKGVMTHKIDDDDDDDDELLLHSTWSALCCALESLKWLHAAGHAAEKMNISW